MDEAAVAEICQRLDEIPLAIELAAARPRALSLTETLDDPLKSRAANGGAPPPPRRGLAAVQQKVVDLWRRRGYAS